MKLWDKSYTKYVIIGIILVIAYKVADNIGYFTNAFFSFIKILTPLIIGGIITFFTYRPSFLLANKLKNINNKFIKRKALTISVVIVYIMIALIIGIIIKFIIPVIIKNIQDLINHIPSYYLTITDFIEKNELLKQLTVNVNLYEKMIKYINTDTLNSVISIVSKIASSFVTFFLSVVFSIYFILYSDRLKLHYERLKKHFFSEEREFVIIKYTGKIVNLFHSYFVGLALDAILIGTVTAIILSIFKVPYSVLLGLIVAFGNMIPFFGSIIAGIVEYVVCALSFGPVNALWVLVFQLVLGQIDGNIIQPKIIGRSVGVSPLTVLVAVVVLGEILGPLGMILGVPVIAAVKIVVEDNFN